MSQEQPKRFGIYFDQGMLEDEKVVKEGLKRQGIKPTRPNVIRFLLHQEAEKIKANTPKK